MFWASVGDGLKVLLHWETYVLGFIYLIIAFIPFYPMMFGKQDDAISRGGCLAMLLQPVFMSLGAVIFIMSLFPIIIGVSSDAAWSLPWLTIVHAPLFILLMVVVMIVLSFLAAFIPIVGQMTSFLTLVMGGTVIAFMVSMIHHVAPSLNVEEIEIMPGFFMTIGILIISAITAYLAIIVAALAATVIDRGEEGIGSTLMIPLGSVFGFIPVFIYGAWIGNQLSEVL